MGEWWRLGGVRIEKKKGGIGGGVRGSTTTYRAHWKLRAGFPSVLGTSVLTCCNRWFLRVGNNTHSPSARDLGPSKQSPWSTTALSSAKMFPLEKGKQRREGRRKRGEGGDSETSILQFSPLHLEFAESEGELERGGGW